MSAGRLSGLLPVVCVLAVSVTAHPAIDRATGSMVSGDRNKARVVLDSLLVSTALDDGERAEATYWRAVLSEDPKEFERLLRLYLREGGKRPQAGDAELRLGRLAYAGHQMEGALEHFEKAANYGYAEEGNLWKGLTASVMGRRGLAEKSLLRAAESGSGGIRQRAWMALGDLEFRGRDFNAAADYYERIRSESQFGPGWWSAATVGLASCYQSLGHEDETQALYEELIRNAPYAYEAAWSRDHLQRTEETGSEASSAVGDTTLESTTFSVQVGAFTIESYATTLADSLKALGYPATVLAADGMHRVVVGKFEKREGAEAMGDSINSRLRTSYQIIERDGF